MALALSALTCAHRPGGSDAPAPTRWPVPLTVENKSSHDLTIYVVHDGRRERLDRIEAARTETFTIPVRMIGMLGDFQLIGERPAFAGRIMTQSVSPKECDRLEWTIEAQLDHSVLAMFPKASC